MLAAALRRVLFGDRLHPGSCSSFRPTKMPINPLVDHECYILHDAVPVLIAVISLIFRPQTNKFADR
jgi:hypothetical protein